LIPESRNIYAFERLFNEHYAAVLLYSTTIVKSRNNAEDIVQQAFISLWQKMGSADFHTSARSYLYKMVYHASLDFLKHEKIKKRYENETIQAGNETIHETSGDTTEIQKCLQYAIDELPKQCGRIFKMSRFDGLKYTEIAAALHISEKTVENQMGKALKILREALKDYLPLILFLLNFYYAGR